MRGLKDFVCVRVLFHIVFFVTTRLTLTPLALSGVFEVIAGCALGRDFATSTLVGTGSCEHSLNEFITELSRLWKPSWSLGRLTSKNSS